MLGVRGENVFFQGASRDCLCFLFDPERHSIEEIDRAFTAEACKSVTLTDENGEAFVHQDYSIRYGLEKGYDSRVSVSTGGETPPLRIAVRMAQVSYLERRQQELEDTVNRLRQQAGM